MEIRMTWLIIVIVFVTCDGDELIDGLEVFEEQVVTESEILELDNTTVVPYLYGYYEEGEEEEETTNPSYFESVTFTPLIYTNLTEVTHLNLTTIINSTATTTGEPKLLYLEFEYEHLDRETFWNNNTFECFNGILRPSPYLRRKYHECEIVHGGHNPKCIPNCRMAITMLLDSQIPNMDLFRRFFEITLPENLREAAINHYSDCFDKFGNANDLLDYKCERPQKFFACMNEFQSQMVCSDERTFSIY